MFEDDPVLGAFVANFPSDRLRLLLTGGALLAVIWFVVTVALWQVEAGLASAITVGVIALATLGIGWYITHYWNREVVFYRRGFSYREGSYIAFFKFEDIKTLRQTAERRSYFAGRLRRTIYRSVLLTYQDERIVLFNLYRRMDELSLRLEREVTQAQRPVVERRLAAGERVPFGGTLALAAEGLYDGARFLPWADFAGFMVNGGRLAVRQRDHAEWLSLPLSEVDNIRLLLDLLQQRLVQQG